MERRTGSQWVDYLQSSEGAERLGYLGGGREGYAAEQAARYAKLIRRHAEAFGERGELLLISAPGRTEIGGNHTDHNRGCVLAAAVNLDTIAVVSPTDDGIMTVHSEGYQPIRIDTASLAAVKREEGTTAAIIRGVAARMRELGYKVGGFQAAVTSNVLRGSGLSSSAAFEVLVCAILDACYNGWTVPGVLRAQISQYAENVYFAKPSGLMDQTASSLGGLVNIDFGGAEPVVRGLQYDFAAKGYALCVVNNGGSHGDLTDDYAAIRTEMEQVAAHFGQPMLRRVTAEQVEAELPALRAQCGDRAVLRAFHYFDENQRVAAQVEALERDDLPGFLREINASGDSSWMLLQNVWSTPAEQPISVALALSKRILNGRGAFRVHGGGFAGTILAFVPNDLLAEYARRMDAVFGEGACTVLDIRPEGAVWL